MKNPQHGYSFHDMAHMNSSDVETMHTLIRTKGGDKIKFRRAMEKLREAVEAKSPAKKCKYNDEARAAG